MLNKLNILCLVVIFNNATLLCNDLILKQHEQWWEKKLPTMMPTFAWWLGDAGALSRVSAREYIKLMDYKSILDIPCGLCTDFLGFQQAGMQIEYLGMDITQLLIDRAVQMGIRVQKGSIENIPLADSTVEICYSRHILEHLDYYHLAITELIRVAAKEVLIVFFIRPTEAPDNINPSIFFGSLCYGNCYNKHKIEQFITSNSKVKNLTWQEIGSENEIILHIYLKNNS